MPTSSDFEPKTYHKKLLYLILLLENRGKMATPEGLVKIANGTLDEETIIFAEEEGFGCLTSLKLKKAKFSLHALIRQGYLEERVVNEDTFLLLSESGRKVARSMLGKVHASHGFTPMEAKRTIIDID